MLPTRPQVHSSRTMVRMAPKAPRHPLARMAWGMMPAAKNANPIRGRRM